MTITQNSKAQELFVNLKGLDIQEAYDKLKLFKKRKRDFTVPARSLRMKNGKLRCKGVRVSQGQGMDLSGMGISLGTQNFKFGLSDIGFSQLCDKLKIPVRYARRMRDNRPGLFDNNVNGWLANEVEGGKPRNFFLRSYTDEPGGNAGMLRAFLSDKYFAYDNLDLLTLALKTIRNISEERQLNIQVDKCDISEAKMYVRFTCPDVAAEAETALTDYKVPGEARGDVNNPDRGITTGFIISNSEVGSGRLLLAPCIKILACTNRMIWEKEAYKRTHLGSQMEEGEMNWAEDTKAKNVELIEKQMRDMILNYLSEDFLGQRLENIEAMAARKLEHPAECCRNMCTEIGLNEDETAEIFNYFIQQGDTSSVFAVSQAMTYYAHKDASPDKRYELEAKSTELLTIVNKCDKKQKVAVPA